MATSNNSEREGVDRWLERIILLLVFGAIGYATLGFGGVRPLEFVVVWWLILGAVLVWALRIWLVPKFRFLWPPLCWAVLPFVAYAVWRYRSSDIEFLARQELIQILLCGLLLIVIVNNLYSQESIRLLCFALVFLAMAVSMYGIFQWLRSYERVWSFQRPASYSNRASGTFINPNHLAGFLAMILPLGIAVTATGRVKPVLRILLAYASAVALVCLAGTQSRGGWLAAVAGLLLLCSLLLQTKGQRLIALLLLIAIAGTGSWLYSRSVAHRVNETYLSGNQREIRLRLWSSAVQVWKTEPWTGVGLDHFDYRYRRYRDEHDKTQVRPGRVHNDYLNTLVDYGIVGLTLVLLPLGVAAWSIVRCWPHLRRTGNDFGQKQSNRSAIVLGAAGGLIALLVHSFFDFNMHIPANALLATTLLGVITVHVRFATERYWFAARWPLATVATFAIVGSLTYLVPQALARSREATLMRRAERQPDGASEKIALLKAAFAAEPKDFELAFMIGEQLRAVAWMGGDHYQAHAQEALDWFKKAIALNRWDVNSYVRSGMCLDWIDQHEEAGPYFAKALQLDPNFYYTRAMMGWHEFQVDHFEQARDWMLKSLNVNWTSNPIAYTYRDLATKKLQEQSSQKSPLR